MKPRWFAGLWKSVTPVNAFLNANRRRAKTSAENVERLEERCLMTAISWISDTDGFWDDPTRWSTGQVPTSGDDVTIDRPGANPVITIRDNQRANTLISRETLIVAAGDFNVSSGATLEASTLTIVTGNISAHGGLTIDGTSQFHWQGGGLFGSITNNGLISLTTTSEVRLGGALHNNATFVHSGTGTLLVDNSTRLNNNAGALLDFTSDGDVGLSLQGSGFAPSLENRGTLRKSGGTGISRLDNLEFNVAGTGVIDIDSGRFIAQSNGTWTNATLTGSGGVLEVGGGYSIGGTLTGEPGSLFDLTGSLSTAGAPATLDFVPGAFHWTGGRLQGNHTIVNSGTLTIVGSSNARLGGRLENNGQILHQATANLLIDGSSRLVNNTTGIVDFQGDGDIAHSGEGSGFSPSVENNGEFRKTSGTGTSAVTGLEFNATSGTFNVTAGRLNVAGGGTWTNVVTTGNANGVLEISGSQGVGGTFQGQGNGRLELTGAIFTAGTPATLNFDPGYFHWLSGGIFGNHTFTNVGTLTITGSSDVRIGGRLDNTGTILHVGSGSLQFDGSTQVHLTSTGVIEFTADGGIERSAFGSGFHPFLQSAGTIRKSGGNGTTSIDGVQLNLSNGAVLDSTSGILTATESGTWVSPVLNATDTGVVRIGGTFSLSGTMTGSGDGHLELAGTFRGSDSGVSFNYPQGYFLWTSGSFEANSTVTNLGTIINTSTTGVSISGHNFLNAGTMIDQGTGAWDISGTVTNQTSGLILLEGAQQITGNGTLHNLGELRKTGGGISQVSVRYRSGAESVIDLQADQLTFTRGGDLQGGQFELAAGTLIRLTGNDVYDFTGNFLGTGLGQIQIEATLRGNDSTNARLNFPQGMFQIVSGQLLGNLVNDGWIEFAAASGLFARAGITNNGTFIHSGTGDFVLNANSRIVNNGLYEIRTDADLVVPGDASGGSMFFINNPTGILRKTGGIGTTSFRHDGNGKELRFDNTGTVEIQTGTLEFHDTVVQVSGSTLTAGTWIVRAFSTLGLPNAQNLTTNQADVTLDGAGSTFTRLDTLTTNAGHLTLGSGRDFITVGNLTNSGSITVSPGSELTVNGNLTQMLVNSLVGWWRADGVATDAANSLNGTLTGNAGFADGQFGQAFQLDGNRDYVDLGNPSALRLQNFTISTWVRRDAAKDTVIFGYGQSGYAFGMLADGKLFLTQTGINHVQTTALRITDNEFHHLAVTKSGSTVTFYVDGVAEVVAPYQATFSFFTNAAIGARADNASNDFAGRIDEVIVYNKALNADDIETLRTSNSPLPIGLRPPTITVEIADRPGTGQFGRIVSTGTVNLAGRLNVARVGGFGPVLTDEYTIFNYASRNGNFSGVGGLSPFFDITVDNSHIALNVMASAADIAVQNVQVPPTATPGSPVTITYTVQNLDNTDATGSWFDSIYLSQDGTYDPSDLLIGRVEHSGGLTANGSYTESLTAVLPGVVDGNYRVIVITDSRGNVGDFNRANNRLASASQITVTLPVLSFDVLTNLTIQPNEDIYLKLDVPFGGDVLITASFLNALQAEFFVRKGALPTRSEYDFVASDLSDLSRTITLASPEAGPYYILLHGREGAAGGSSFSLLAENIQFDLQEVTPNQGSNLGSATTVLTGAGFTGDTIAELVDGLGNVLATATSRLINPNRLFATFHLVGVAAGTYDVRVSRPGFTETLSNAYEVIVGAPGEVRVGLIVPGAVRAGRIYTGYVEYQNIGNTDVTPPLILIDSTSPLTFDLDAEPSALSYRFLAISPEGPAGVLAPGQKVTVPFRFYGNGMSIEASTISPDAAAVMDWDALRIDMRPANAQAGWDAIFNQQFVSAGTTVGDYVRLLADAATLYQSREGVSTNKISDLHGILLAEGFANRDAVIRGQIFLDSANQPVGGIPITAVNRLTGETAGGLSTADGVVRIPGLPPGTYDMFFEGVLAPVNLQPVVVAADGSSAEQTWIVRTGGRIQGRVAVQPEFPLYNDMTGVIFTVEATDQAGRKYSALVGENNYYEFKGLPTGTYDLAFRTNSTLPVFINDVQVVEGASTPLIDLFSPAGGTVRGRVTRAGDNQPLAGVLVFAVGDPNNPRFAITNAQGEYLLQGVTPGTITVRIDGAGIIPTDVTGVAVAAQQTTSGVNVIVDLGLAATVSGTVSDNGQPVANASVDILQNGLVIASDVTGADGIYVLEELAPGQYELVIDTYGFGVISRSITVVAAADLDEDFDLERAGEIHGTVRYAGVSGQLFPVTGLRLAIQDELGEIFQIQTDAAGIFSASRLLPGLYTLMLADGSHRQQFEIQSATDELDLSFQIQTGLLFGTLLDTDGETPLSNVTATLVKDGQTLEVVSTRVAGEFFFGAVAPGTYDIHFRSDDRFFEPRLGVTLTGTHVDVGDVIAATATLDLNLTNAATSQNITTGGGVILVQIGSVGPVTRLFPVDATGSILITGLAPGQYVLQSAFSGFALTQTPITVVAGANSFTQALSTGAAVSGTISDEMAAPAAGIQLFAYNPATPHIRWNAITDANGEYALSLPAGTYTIVVADLREGADIVHLAHQTLTGVVVTNGQTLQQNVQLLVGNASLSGTINGDVSDQINTAPLNAVVTLVTLDGIPVASTLANSRGEFEFDGVSAGQYRIEVRSPGFHYALLTQTVNPGVNSGVNPSGTWTNPSLGGPSDQALPPEFDLDSLPFTSQETAFVASEDGGLMLQSSLTTFNLGGDQVSGLIASATTFLRDKFGELLGEPQADPTRFGGASNIPDACPDAFAAYREVLKWQRAADGRFDAWLMRWQGAQEVLWANVGLFGVALGKFATGLLFSAPIQFSASKLDELVQARNAIPLNSNTFDEFIESMDKFNQINHEIAKAYAIFQDQLGNVENLLARAGLVDGVVSSYSAVTAGEGIPTVGDVFDAFAGITSWTTLADFFGFLNTVSSFGSGVLQLADTIKSLLAVVNQLPGAQKFIGAAGNVGNFLGVISALAQGVTDSVKDVESLAEFEKGYQDAIAERNKAFERFLDILEKCKDDDEDDTDEPDEPRDREDLRQLFLVQSSDPNDIIGPDGSGSPGHYMRVDQTFPYTILFENKPEATAPAQEVIITQQLDSDLDWSTFELGDFGFGDLIIDVPTGRNFYQTRVDLSSSHGIFVDFTAGIDFNTGLVTWRFVTIDPETGDIVADALAGFLPPNDASHQGEGFVEYLINPKSQLTTGVTITAQASIVFDTNEPLLTPVYTNTIDIGLPTSSMNELAATQEFPTFQISWTGIDDAAGPQGSGARYYDVYVSDNGGEFLPFLTGTTSTTALFTGQVNHTYSFFSVATDGVGFRQILPVTGQTSTEVLDVPYDFGDAPDPLFAAAGKYPTLLQNNGARHRLGTGLFFGTSVDREFDGQPNASATGDDLAGTPDDEDGIQINGLIRGTTGGATVIASQTGMLDAWIDFNRDGDWDDPGEHIADGLSLVGGSNQITFAVPAGAAIGNTYGRFRLSSTGGLGVIGAAADGEVEDVQIAIAAPFISNFGAAPEFVKKQAPVSVLPQVFVSSTGFAGGSLTLSVNAVGSKKKSLDQYDFGNIAAIGTASGPSYQNGRITLTVALSQNATAASIQAFLRGVTFTTKGKGLKAATRTLQVTLAKLDGLTSTVNQTINVRKK